MYLITGATGNVGRPLVTALLDAGASVRATTRDADGARLPSDVEVAEVDPNSATDLGAAMAGVDAVFLNSAAVRGSLTEVVALARDHGVRRLVGLSAFNIAQPRALQPSRFFGHRNAETEAAVVDSGLEWTSLRPSTFAGPAHFALWAPQSALGDEIAGPVADFAEPIIDPRDVAEVAALALLTDDLVGQRPVLTGPQVLSHAELVTILGSVLDRPLRYRELDLAEAAARMSTTGLPAAMVASFIARFAAYRDAGPQPEPTPTVARLLGRPPRSFADWAHDHAAAFG